VYFIPLFVPLCLFIATALIALWRHRRSLLIGLVCVMVVATVPFLYDKSAMNHRLSEAQVPWQRAPDTLPGKSLVIIRDSGPYLLHLNPFSQNGPDLDGRVLYAVDKGAESFRLIDHYPDRTPYIERTSNPRLDDAIHHPDASPPTVTMLPVKIVSGPAVTLTIRVRNPQHAPAVVVVLTIGNRVEQRSLQPSAADDGVYETQWTLVPEGASVPAASDAIPVSGQGVFSVTSASGASVPVALTAPQSLARYPYRVHDGAVQVLDPPRKTASRAVGGRIVQRDVGTLSTLHIDVST
jgi:hypothetical protein